MEEEEQVLVFHLRMGHERKTVGPRLRDSEAISLLACLKVISYHYKDFSPHFCQTASQEDTSLLFPLKASVMLELYMTGG